MIPVGKVGKITQGPDNGKFIRVEDDLKNTGGFLILLSSSEQFKDGSDDWVENRDSLDKYFLESQWTVVWND